MNYTTTFRKRAAKEYLEAIAWYKERSLTAAEKFVKAVNETLAKIESEPNYFRKSYNQFHEAKTRKFPYSIIYFIDEEKNRAVITSIFHQKRNPYYKFGK